MHGYCIAAGAVLLVVAAAACVSAFRRFSGGSVRRREATANTLLLLLVLAFLALGLEAFFYFFAVQSDGFEFTLSAQRWAKLYGGPTNSDGYRDVEHTPESLRGKRILMALGDSFTKGNGIRDYRDRFSSRLGVRLGEDWAVVTVARGGWDTTDELKALQGYPHKPEVLLLQYYLNDIKHAALAKGLEMVPVPPPPPRWLKPLVDYSYAVNYVYWRTFRLVQVTTNSFWGNITRYYADDALWQAHRAAIQQLMDYARGQGMRVLVVVFPNPSDVENSRPLTARVAATFESFGAQAVDLAPVLSGRPMHSLICSELDTHPNEAVHAETADILYQKLEALGWLAPQ